jgi:hypothetical protein
MKLVTFRVIINSTGFNWWLVVESNEYLYGCEMKIL